VIALAKPDGEAGTVHGRCTGRILHGPRGQGGFGYDPLFQPDGQSSTFAQLAPGTKDSISHRGRAVAQLPALLGPALRLASADSVV
jgi:XTP/dITP diphosphohydrolase